jgi:hypothetical protein
MRKKVKKVIKGLQKASKTHAKQAKVLKSGLKVFKARGGMDASQSDFKSPGSSVSGASRGPAGGASAGGNYGGNRNPSQTYGGSGGGGGNRPPSSPPKRKIGGPDTTKDVPYKSNPMVNLVAGAVIPGGGLLGEAAQRKAYKDRQKYARKEGLYREYYIGNQFKTDPSARVLKPNSPEGKAFIKEAKPAPKPKLGGGDNGGGIPRCPDGTLPPCTKVASAPKLPMGKAKVEPKMFEFNFNQGGLVRGAGKILKDRNRKVRIF